MSEAPVSDPWAMTAVIAAFGAPMLLAAALPLRALRRVATAAAPWAALPALGVFLAADGAGPVQWRAALLGMRLGAEGSLSWGFLLLTAVLWLAAGLFARRYMAAAEDRTRFWMFFLASMSGNIGLVLSQDVASFYFFYALMTYAAYGLVVHEATSEARRAGRVYLIMSLAGEMAVISAIFFTVGPSMNVPLAEVPGLVGASAERALITGLFLLGFGVKAGAFGVHYWLPLAHPVAPTPASAVLSGAMIKAALFGWLVFLPIGVVEMPMFGLACVIVGFAGAYAGVLLGVLQREPKTVLAYSSVSQMGFMLTAVGVALATPAAQTAVVAATVFYAVHHAFSKGALFLGTGVAKEAGAGWPQRLVALGLLWPALNIAGAPLSTGALAKTSFKHIFELAPWDAKLLHHLLSLGAIGSTLVVAHFLLRTIPARQPPGRVPAAGLWVPWSLLLVFDGALLVWTPVARDAMAILLEPGKLWEAAWPVLIASSIAALVWRFRERLRPWRRRVPPGDLLVVVERCYRLARSVLQRAEATAGRMAPSQLSYRRALPQRAAKAASSAVDKLELALVDFRVLGVLFVSAATVMLAVLWSRW